MVLLNERSRVRNLSAVKRGQGVSCEVSSRVAVKVYEKYRVGRDFSYTMQSLAVSPVSADVVFASTRFPNYKNGANDQIEQRNGDGKLASMKEVIARETAQLLEQQKTLICS
ncbi:hypothetical protein R6Q57_005850 [Mikania cordata]